MGMRVAVVDGFGSGRWLTRELADRGAECVHVKSRPALNTYLEATFRPEDYVADLGHDPDSGRQAARLAGAGVEWIVAGNESGVRTADALTRLTGLPGNVPALAAARRHKQEMAACLRAAGLDAPLGTTVRSAEEAVAWFGSVPVGPAGVVVKPVDSAGSDHVRFCTTAEQVRSACDAVLASANVFGSANQTAVVQEALAGPEYYVNTVSIDGTHLIAETWLYTKARTPAGAPLFDFEEPADLAAPEVQAVHDYVRRALDALGIRHGAAHSEVVLTARGPVLIDPGARLGGGVLPWVAEKFLGYSHAGLLAESILRPREVLRRAERFPEPWPGPIRYVSLINRRAGTVLPTAGWAGFLEALPSAIAVAPVAGPGLELPVTHDLTTAPGFVYLSAPDRAEIERDYRTIREWEQQGPYTAPGAG
jgi:biotin carboxylase